MRRTGRRKFTTSRLVFDSMLPESKMESDYTNDCRNIEVYRITVINFLNRSRFMIF